MNAFTTKEETCVYASILTTHLQKLLNSWQISYSTQYSRKGNAKGKSCVIDEINSYKDNPAEWIHDEFDESSFPVTNWGKISWVLRSPEEIRAGRPGGFIQRQYSTRQMVLSSVGNVSFARIFKLTGKYFGSQSESSSVPGRQTLPAIVSKPLLAIRKAPGPYHPGNLAFNQHDERRIPMALLNNLLGGPAMNSASTWPCAKNTGCL